MIRLDMMRKSVEDQLDINLIINKLNMVEKLMYIVAGDKYKKLLCMTLNPYIKYKEPKEGGYLNSYKI